MMPYNGYVKTSSHIHLLIESELKNESRTVSPLQQQDQY